MNGFPSAFFSCSLVLLLTVPSVAQGLLVERRGADPGRAGITLERTAIRADIVDGVATTLIEQTFHNHGRRDAEGTWFLPTPRGAVADGFTMTVGGKELSGEILDTGQARRVYESIVRRKRDPGLLEYAGFGMIRARVYPIPAQGDVTVKVRLRQVLEPVGSLFEWNWPLRSMKFGDTGCGRLLMEVGITSQTRLSTVVTPHGTAAVDRKNDHEARVTFESNGEPIEDLKVLYGLSEQEFGLHLLTWRELADPGYFVMLVSPPRKIERELPPRCVQFVVDTSGSMKGEKIEQARRALRIFLKSLGPNDLFQVVTFASGVQTFFDAPKLANPENLAAAERKIARLEARGGTNIAGALERAFRIDMPTRCESMQWLGQIVFVTDGEPTVGLTDPGQILQASKAADRNETRLFALGVGDDIDVRLIDDLVRQHRGARGFVRNREKIEAKVDALCQKIAFPALTDVEVQCDDLESFDVHPSSIRDLFCGEMLQLVGRYRNSGMKTVHVRGKQGGVQREFVFEVEFPELSERHSFVRTIWARQHIAALLDAIRRNGPKKELISEISALAKRYGIVTPYTSQLIVEEGRRLADAGPLAPSGGSAAPASPTPDKSLRKFGRTRTGAEAVDESLELEASLLNTGAPVGDQAKFKKATSRGSLVRRVGARVFVQAGEDLVEQGLPADWKKTAVVVETFSEEYFALLRARPKLRPILALGDRIALRDGGRILYVRPAP